MKPKAAKSGSEANSHRKDSDPGSAKGEPTIVADKEKTTETSEKPVVA